MKKLSYHLIIKLFNTYTCVILKKLKKIFLMLTFVQEINDELVEKQIYAIEEIVPYFSYIQEKFSLT